MARTPKPDGRVRPKILTVFSKKERDRERKELGFKRLEGRLTRCVGNGQSRPKSEPRA